MRLYAVQQTGRINFPRYNVHANSDMHANTLRDAPKHTAEKTGVGGVTQANESL